MKEVLIVLCLILLVACNSGLNKSVEQNDRAAASTADQKNNIIKKPGSTFQDTLALKGDVALIFNPDTLQLYKIKAVNKSNDYETMTHQAIYMIKNAKKVIKTYWPKLKLVETEKCRFLLFKKDDGTSVLVDLDEINDISGMLLFNGKKNPQVVDMMNIDTELYYYFNDK